MTTSKVAPPSHAFNWRSFAQRWAIWFGCATLICLPSSLTPHQRLLGDPAIDVWNHAWGYWFVFQSLLSGILPLETPLIGAPAGGTIYYIDTPGAVIALPFTAIFGPAVGYNLVLLGRLAIAGLATQSLLEEWIEKNTVWGWLAGWGTMTLPFLLCELSNGISEVCAIQWGICALWMTERATRHNRWTDWIGLGIFQGLTIAATFYYGLAFGLLLIVLILGRIGERSLDEGRESLHLLNGAVSAAAIALFVASPYAFTFWMSIQSDSRLVMRDNSLHEQLLRHNAVDPKIYWMWGEFQSVDLKEKYGEPFVHTAYLRWSLLPFAIWAGIKHSRLRLWLGAMILSLILGLGNFLWWNEDWVYVGEQMISLPFDWIRQVLPQIAITHPLRLSIGGQVICVLLGIVGWRDLLTGQKSKWLCLLPLSLITIESLWGSSAQWPLPSSDATISSVYQLEPEDERGVLDLPAEVGTSMETSRYFWYQSVHGKPIPYTPDARLGSTRDLQTFKNFMGDGMKEEPHALDTLSMVHMRKVYQSIVVHPELDATKAAAYADIFTDAFGEPTRTDGLLHWNLKALTEDEHTPELETKATTATPYSSDGEVLQSHSCQRIADLTKDLLSEMPSDTALSMRETCASELKQFCVQRSKNPSIQVPELTLCVKEFAKSPTDDLQYALLHIFRHPDDDVKIQFCTLLAEHPSLIALLPKERVLQLSSSQPPTLQESMRALFTP